MESSLNPIGVRDIFCNALRPGRSLQHRLNVDDRRSVNRFDWSDAQAASVDSPYGDRMEPQWVRPIRGPGRKDTREWIARIGPWVDFQDVAIALVKPRDDDDFVANGKTQVATESRPTRVLPWRSSISR